MPATPAIRAKKSHRKLFSMTPWAHGTADYCVKNDMPFPFFTALQVAKPDLSQSADLPYQALVTMINEVAALHGCDEDDCPEGLVDHSISAEVAYAVVRSSAARAMMNCNTRDELLKLAQPLKTLIDRLQMFGTLRDSKTDRLPGMLQAYKTASAMSFRKGLDDLDQFDESKSSKQADLSCKRILAAGDFDHLGDYFSKDFYSHLALKLGSRHGAAQAEAKKASNAVTLSR